MNIHATSDLHLDQSENYQAFLKAFKTDRINKHRFLILAGDICESEEQLREILVTFKRHYQEIFWVPGNHELWIRPSMLGQYSGSEEKYFKMVEVCRQLSVHTPEDDFLETETLVFAPLFLLYDYSYRPANITQDKAVEWAMESNVLCTDEVLIRPHPYNSIPDWCQNRLEVSLNKLQPYTTTQKKLVLINHFPFRQDSFQLKYIPRFSIWCGTSQTHNWHLDYPCAAAIHGHLHLPSEQKINGIPFYEVSLGYPGQWDSTKTMDHLFKEIRL